MATPSVSRRARGTAEHVRSVPRDPRLDNSPNARKLLASLRYLGYDNLYAISDLVDNSIDADASRVFVSIQKVRGDYVIDIADDGTGMTEAELDQASRLGSETPRNSATDLGRFGMGLVTASLSMGRRLTIVTKTAGGPLLANVTDVDHMMAENAFVRERFGNAASDDETLFNAYLQDAESGTVVRITKSDGFTRKSVGAFETRLTQHLGQTYRMFIRASRKLFVNSEEVPVNDPLWLDHAGTVVYSDEVYDIKYADTEGKEIKHPVRARLVILPDHGSTTANKQAGYNVQKAGFFVLRNNREIAAAQLLDIKPLSRHPDFIRFRAELFVPGSLDEGLGIEFTKRDIKLTQSVHNQLESAVGGTIQSLRNQIKKRVTRSAAEKVDHQSSERLIDSKSSLLMKPAPRAMDGSTTPLGSVKFRLNSFGREGPIYACEQQGRTIFIDWNVDHPFYSRFVLANRDDRDALNAIDALIFSLATAELRTFDEEAQHFVETWKTVFSSNMRILLS